MAFQAFLARRADEESEFQIDYLSVLEELKDNLPDLPERPEVEQQNPPPYNLPRIKFGKLMPKPEEEDPKKKKKQKKKQQAQRKKDEPPPKPIKWADPPSIPEP